MAQKPIEQNHVDLRRDCNIILLTAKSPEIAEAYTATVIYMQLSVVFIDDLTCLLAGGTVTALFFHVLHGYMVSHVTNV